MSSPITATARTSWRHWEGSGRRASSHQPSAIRTKSPLGATAATCADERHCPISTGYCALSTRHIVGCLFCWWFLRWFCALAVLALVCIGAAPVAAAPLDLVGSYDPGTPGLNASVVGMDGFGYMGSWAA